MFDFHGFVGAVSSIPKLLIVAGIALMVLGAIRHLGSRYFSLGRLPGDIVVERPGSRFYFPLATCILLSIVLTIILSLWQRFGR